MEFIKAEEAFLYCFFFHIKKNNGFSDIYTMSGVQRHSFPSSFEIKKPPPSSLRIARTETGELRLKNMRKNKTRARGLLAENSFRETNLKIT